MTATARTIEQYIDRIQHTATLRRTGRVVQTLGLAIESQGPSAALGEVCRIEDRAETTQVLGEVVGLRGERVVLMPLGDWAGVAVGARVVALGAPLSVAVGDAVLGRVLDGLGHPIDGGESLRCSARRTLLAAPPSPLQRRRICEPLATGIRALDALLTCGRGQRVGIFSGSGVGKSILLGMLARHSSADVNVIALVGERGREIREFLERDLDDVARSRSVIVAATSDQPALVRLKAALVATTLAEYFRDQGADVLLVMDSLTRVAMAQREIGLAAGEPPATKGYPPSVFAFLPKLLERSGMAARGSITGMYTVLVEGDDMADPVADTTRAILDGHVVLSRKLASEGHYPAIDVLQSTSRVMTAVARPEQEAAAAAVREWLALYADAEDLITIGAYRAGQNQRLDAAVRKIDAVRAFLRQGRDEAPAFDATIAALRALAGPSPA